MTTMARDRPKLWELGGVRFRIIHYFRLHWEGESDFLPVAPIIWPPVADRPLYFPWCCDYWVFLQSNLSRDLRQASCSIMVGALGFEPRSAGIFRLACTRSAHALGLRRVGAPVGHQIHQKTHSSSFPCNWSPRYYQVILYPRKEVILGGDSLL